METDNRETVPLDEGLSRIILGILRGRLDTVTVGIVEKYDPGRQVVSVQPAIMRKRENEESPSLRPIIEDVRVVFPGSGDYWITFPIVPGDPVLLLVPSRSLDVWFASGGIVDPGSPNMFDLSDAVAIPGILDDGSIIPELKTDGVYVRTRQIGGGLDPSLPASFIRLHPGGVDVQGNLTVEGEITATGDITSETGDVVATGVSLRNHTHTVNGVQPGSGSVVTTPPIPPGD